MSLLSYCETAVLANKLYLKKKIPKIRAVVFDQRRVSHNIIHSLKIILD